MNYNFHDEPDESPPERDEYQEYVDEQLTKEAIHQDNASKRADEYRDGLIACRTLFLDLRSGFDMAIRNIDELITKHEL